MGKDRLSFAALLAAGILALQGEGRGLPAPAPLLPGDPRPPSKWTCSRGPGGARILHPADFRAYFGPRGRVRVLGDRGRILPTTPFLLVRPVLTLPGETALAWLERSLLPGFLSLPGARLLERREIEAGRALLRVGYPLRGTEREALLYCALQNGSGMSYVLSSPADTFRRDRPLLARIARSLRYGAKDPSPLQAGGLPPPEGAFRTWKDPREGAFSLEIPLRWKAEGGLVKRGPLDFTPTVRLVGPEGKVRVLLGHRRCSYFVEPDPELLATGFQEGRWYFSSWGGSLRVLAYKPGAAFPREFLFVPPFAPRAFRIVAEHPLPELARSALAAGMGGTPARADAGFLLFTCREKRIRVGGFILCVTLRLAPRMRRRIWRPLLLAGWTAAPGREELADRVLGRALRTFRLDPAWEEAQPGLGKEEGTLLRRTFRAAADWLSESLPERKKTLARALAPLVPDRPDPAALPVWRIAWGRNYYWAPPLSPAPPDLDLSPLEGGVSAQAPSSPPKQ